MLTAYFDPAGRRIRELRTSPAGSSFNGFARTLSEAGYATITARRYLRAAEHFIYWSDRNRRPVQDADEKSLVQFGHHLNRCRCPHQGHADHASLTQGARLFLKYLRDAGISTVVPVTLSVVPHAGLLCRDSAAGCASSAVLARPPYCNIAVTFVRS